MLYTNQFIEQTRIERENCKRVFKYLENQNNKIVYFDLDGCILYLNECGKLYETSINIVSEFINDIKYTKKEIDFSNLVKLYSNLIYLDNINPKLRKLQCIINRIKLKIKELIKKDVKRKNFKINKRKSRMFKCVMFVGLFRK